MRDADVLDLVKNTLIPMAQDNLREVQEADQALSTRMSDHPLERVIDSNPRRREKRDLKAISRTPLLNLIIRTVVQQCVLDDVISGEESNQRIWQPWERNGLPSRQSALYKGVLSYAHSYALLTPGIARGEPAAVIRFLSPKALTAVYDDEDGNEYPMYALRTIPQGENTHYRLYDEEKVYYLSKEDEKLRILDTEYHGIGVCPVVRYGDFDLDGNATSEIDRHKVVSDRYDKTTYDRLQAQHYNSWKVRTATGLEEANTLEAQERQNTKLAHDDILVGTEGVQFGTLPETNLDGLLRAAEADRDMLAAVSQTPVWALNGGQLVNLSAEALAESRSMSRLKIEAFQRLMGRSHATMFRLAAHIEGRAEDAENYDLSFKWRNFEAGTLAQVADALGKLAQIGVPDEKLWEMIPNVTKQTVREWMEWAEQHPNEQRALAQALTAG